MRRRAIGDGLTTWRVVAVAVGAVAALGLASCSSGGSDAGSGTTTTRSATGTTSTDPGATPTWPKPRFVAGTCPMPLPKTLAIKVSCGTVKVPENRSDPKSRWVTLAVARLHSRSAHPAPDPVVDLGGGPGFASLSDVLNFSTSRMLDRSDLYLWDQRGTGYSTPDLNCPEADEAVWRLFETTDADKVEGRRLMDAMVTCRSRLLAHHVDLGGYNTVENAADLADLRVALGLKEWNLRGVSYGSALAQQELRAHPQGVRSVLLDSVVTFDRPFGAVGRGQSALASFAQLRAACAAQPTCKAKYGDTDALIARAAQALDDHPYRTDVTEEATGRTRHVALTGRDLVAGLFRAMYDETLIPAVPQVLTQIANGQDAILDQLAKQSIPFAVDQYEAMTVSFDCADHQDLMHPDDFFSFLAAHTELGALMWVGPEELGCKRWDVPSIPTSTQRLLTRADTKVPVLVMAGRFDPITPVAGTQRVAKALGTTALLFPNAGHGAVGSSDCARGIWLAFLDHPDGRPDTSCMAKLAPPTFA